MLNPNKTGAAVGVFAGLVHLAWAALIGLGWAQGLLDSAYELHMVKVATTVQAFDLGTAVMLVIMATIVGYIVGSVFAAVWNWIQR